MVKITAWRALRSTVGTMASSLIPVAHGDQLPPGDTISVRPARGRLWSVAALLGATGLMLVVACSEASPGMDRAAAVQKVIADSKGAVTQQQAECYVNRVVDEVGAGALAEDARPTPSQLGRLTSIRIDCVGVANLGRSPGTGTVRPLAPEETSARRLPHRRGDDPNLDLLYEACAQGNGRACDDLFDAAPPGSDYEEFAVTCGGRTREKRCADVYSSGSPPPTSGDGQSVPPR